MNESYTTAILKQMKDAYDVVSKYTIAGLLFDEATDQVEITKDLKNAISSFTNNYLEMVEFNYKDSDKFFHCLANCEAVKYGWSGEMVAIFISELREQTDMILKGKLLGKTQYTPEDSEADHKANRHGRNHNSKNTNCVEHCKIFSEANPSLAPDYAEEKSNQK